MAIITFSEDGTLGAGAFIGVLRNGRPFGRIYYATGTYRFYQGNLEKLGGADLKDEDLEALKATIRSRYDR